MAQLCAGQLCRQRPMRTGSKQHLAGTRATRTTAAQSLRLLAESPASPTRVLLKALADGETNPAALAALAHERLRATPEQLCDALGACTDLKPVYRQLLKMALEQLQLLEQQIGQLDQELATLLHPHQDAVQRLAEVPGLGVDSAQRRERRRKLQPPISEGQPSHAAITQSGG